jgi:hypothetical protein
VVDIAIDMVKGARMKFIVGDFFKLSKKVAGSFEAVFDRGSLVLCVCVCVCECVRESVCV